MQLQFLNRPTKNSLLVYPVFQKTPPKDAAVAKLTASLAKSKEFSAKANQTYFLFERIKSLPAHVVLLGLGDAKKLTVSSVMEAFGSAVKLAMAHNSQKLSLNITNEQLHVFAEEIAQAVVLANYQAGIPYKTGKSLTTLRQKQIHTIEITGLNKNKLAQDAFKKGVEIALVTNEARDWVNAPPNYATPTFFDEKAKEIAKHTGAKLTILRKKDVEKMHMGGLLSVNRGSPDEPRLVIFDYTPKNADTKKPPVVFVGKGVIFDSGGYNLKPHGHIEDMQLDKAGAVDVFMLMKLLPLLNLKHRVICVAPMTENLIGKHAAKPSEIIKMYTGKTVEISNTDAEGRLILADAIAYAVHEFKPKLLVDLATLTGACMIALGDRYAGLFGNDENLIAKLRQAGDKTDELLWPLPIHQNHSEKIKGRYADLRNADAGSERYAGASKGAAFLKEFVGKTKWAHLDIAGPAFTTDPKRYESKGATGFGIRALVRFLEDMDAPA